MAQESTYSGKKEAHRALGKLHLINDQRRVRSFRTASSMRAPSSLRVSETCSPAESPPSLVIGRSAPPPGGGATKYLEREASSVATSRLESSYGSPPISAARVIFAEC